MRTALKPGRIININGTEYEIVSLLSSSGGMSLIYEARQCVGQEGYAGKTVIKEFFPTSNALRREDGLVYCASKDEQDILRFEELRRSMIEEGVIGDDARQACSQVYAFDHAWNGYAVMRKLSKDTFSLAEILNAWQTNPPSTDEEYSDMARLRYALRITHSLLTGLQTIHKNAGIIHRDISLGNIVWASADFAKDGSDGRAYFLDFGSALRMDNNREARNVSDPLKLFGTYSFAAPEIWELGGVLTPAADLFSVSAILLLLCCGKKCCIRMKPGWHLASQANVGRLYENDYVVKSALEKLNIPPDIRGRLQDFLLEGLSRDPSKRFEKSALKMLETLETLQIKCAPRQRLREYAAFISYHHRPLDKAVARRLHRLIEQYRIPAELAKERESNRLGLCFRDEDELPVSTDLTDNIQEALDHSDYLIVICTPGTPNSIWVEQEIAYFLRHHDRNHVLAVLAEGRPEESFPPHLVHLYDENDNIVGDTEYLAANIAGKSKTDVLRNLNKEKLRIIAAMLGCPYDSLYQREKRYQLQRYVALFGTVVMALAIFSTIILTKNSEIRNKNRVIERQSDEVLTNESNALSREAQLKYQSGDVVGALECALTALPDEHNGRPYTAISEQVLSDILDPYEFGNARIQSILYQDTEIVHLELDNETMAIYTLDKYGGVRAFDIGSGTIKWNYKLENSALFEESLFLKLLQDRHSVIAHSGKDLVLLNADDGSVIWKKDQYSGSIQISDDGNSLVLFDTVYSDGTNHYVAQFCSVEDGTVIRTVNCDEAVLSDSLSSLRFASLYLESEAVFYDAKNYFSVSYASDALREKKAEMVVFEALTGDSAKVLNRQSFEMVGDSFLRPIALRYFESDNTLMLVLVNAGGQEIVIEKLSAQSGEVLYSREYTWATTFEPSSRCFTASDTHAFLGLGKDLFCFDVATGDMLAKSLDNSANFGIVYADNDISNAAYVVTDSGIYCLVACINDNINYANFDHQRLNLGSISNASLGNHDCISPVKDGGNFATGYVAKLNPDALVAVVPSAYGNRVMVFQPSLGGRYYMEGIGVDWTEYVLDTTGRLLIDREDGRIFDLETRQTIELPQWNSRCDLDDLSLSLSRNIITYFSDDSLCAYSLDNGEFNSVKLPGIPDSYSNYPLSEATLQILLEDEELMAALEESDMAAGLFGSLTTSLLGYRNCASISSCDDGTTLSCLFENHKLQCWRDGDSIDITQPTDALPEYHDAIDRLYEGNIKVVTNGSYIIIANGEDDVQPFILIFNLKTDEWKAVDCEPLSNYLDGNKIENTYCLSKKTAMLAYVTNHDELVIYNLESGQLTLRIPLESNVRSIESMKFIDNDTKIFCLEENRAAAYDVKSGTLKACDYYHSYKSVTVLTSVCNITEDEERRRLYIADPAGAETGICIDMDSWTRVGSIPYQIAYSHYLDSSLIYDYPGYWHPNIVGYVSSVDLPENQRGICCVPSLGLSDLREEGLSIIHMLEH